MLECTVEFIRQTTGRKNTLRKHFLKQKDHTPSHGRVCEPNAGKSVKLKT